MIRQFTIVSMLLLGLVSFQSKAQFQADFWIGNGPDTAYLVIEFQDGQSPSSFVWGYLFEDADSIDGNTFFNEVAAGDPALQPVFDGGFLNAINYKNHSKTNEDPFYWSYTQFVDANWNGDYWAIEKLIPNGIYGFNYEDWQNPVTIATPTPAQRFTKDDVKFWIGQGDDEAVFIVDFHDSTEVEAFAWGYRFTESDSIDGSQLLEDIDEADASLEVIGAFIDQVKYETHSQSSEDPFYWFVYERINLGWESVFWTNATIHNDGWYGLTYTSYLNEIVPGEPLPVEESIVPFYLTFDKLEYWVGEGVDSAMVVLDFASGEESAFAWGVRFDDSIQFEAAIQLIVDADDSLEVTISSDVEADYLGMDGSGLQTYLQLNDTIWSALFLGQNVGHLSINTVVFSENALSATLPIPAQLHKYAPAAGEVGSTAISMDSPLFVNWATGVTELIRGYINISDTTAEADSLNRASYGIAEDAVGAVTNNNSVVSLGDAGSITLTFEHNIFDGEGADFAIFENSFSATYLELAFVEVSSDGINFVRFPSITLAPTADQISAFGSSDPRDFYNLAGKYEAGFGVPFDLKELEGTFGLDVQAVTHVRIVDVVGSIDPMFGSMDSKGTMINDPFPTEFVSGGFDLEGVGVINQDPATGLFETEETKAISIYPNPAIDALHCDFEIDQLDDTQLIITNAIGEVLFQKQLGVLSAGPHKLNVDLSDMNEFSGILFVSIYGDHTNLVTSVFKK